MKNLKKFIKEILLFMFIGIVIDSFFMIAILSETYGVKKILTSFFISGLIGIGIGTVTKLFLTFLLKRTINLKITIICEFIVVTILTSVVSYFNGGRDIIYLIVIPAIGGSFATIITYFYYSVFINRKLKNLQNNLKNK